MRLSVVCLVLIKPFVRPHLAKRRKIHQGQKIHSSLVWAAGEVAEEYTPEARPFNDDPSFWEMLRDKEKEPTANGSQWLEFDLYYVIKRAIQTLVTKGDDTALTSLHHTSISGKFFWSLMFFIQLKGFSGRSPGGIQQCNRRLGE